VGENENVVIVKRVDSVHIVLGFVLWWSHGADPQRLAELTLLRVAQTMSYCLRFCWHDAFNKGERNFNQIL